MGGCDRSLGMLELDRARHACSTVLGGEVKGGDVAHGVAGREGQGDEREQEAVFHVECLAGDDWRRRLTSGIRGERSESAACRG
jgi:hypothetical protein